MKHVDGWLYIGIGICTALTNSFTTEAAAKFVSPPILFWFCVSLSAVNAGLLAAKMYRSTSFADNKMPAEPIHQEQIAKLKKEKDATTEPTAATVTSP